MTADDVIAVIRQTLAADSVTVESRMGSPRNWDSLSQLQVMLALEGRLGTQLPAELFGELTSVEAIVSYLAEEGLLTR